MRSFFRSCSVSTQRSQFTEFAMSGGPSLGKKKVPKSSHAMTQERFQMLKGMGFDANDSNNNHQEEGRDDAGDDDGDHRQGGQKRSAERESDDRQDDSSQAKKRRKTWKDWKNEVATTTESPFVRTVTTNSEERDAPDHTAATLVAPVPVPPAKTRSTTSAFETLMNVAALVQPLPEPPKKKSAKAAKPAFQKYNIKRAMSQDDVSVTKSTTSNSDVVSNQARWEVMFDKLKVRTINEC